MVVIVYLEEHPFFDNIVKFIISHWSDALLDILVEGLNVKRMRDDLHHTAHLKKGANLHLSVLVFDVSLAENLK